MNSARPNRSGIRSRYQRAFFDWHRANRERFAVPLRVACRTDSLIVANFIGITPLLSVGVSRSGLDVAVAFNDECFDLLLSLDVAPLRTPAGYVCRMCELAGRRLYDSREALWHDHLFEPFLEWVNSRLATARWLRLLADDGWRFASLLVRVEERERAQEGQQPFAGPNDAFDGPPAVSERAEATIAIVPLRLVDGGPKLRDLRSSAVLGAVFGRNGD